MAPASPECRASPPSKTLTCVARTPSGIAWRLWIGTCPSRVTGHSGGCSRFAVPASRSGASTRSARTVRAADWRGGARPAVPRGGHLAEPGRARQRVDKVAAGATTKPSWARRREEIVASYWQRYCAKNDTIGFFGPLAWGQFAADGPPLRMRFGPLVRDWAVRLESWGVQALATSLDESLVVAGGSLTERELARGA